MTSIAPEINDHSAFWNEARFQVFCAGCERAKGSWEAHHVVYQQECVRAGAPEHSPRNVLRVCTVVPGGCHQSHHAGTRWKIPLLALRECNIAFAEQYLGAGRAYNYLTRHYGGSDPRVEALLERA